MKKTTKILTIVGVLFLLTGAVLLWQKVQAPVEPVPRNGDGSVEVPEGWKTYRNEELGFEVSYPGEWFINYGDKLNHQGAIFTLTSPTTRTLIENAIGEIPSGDIYVYITNLGASNLGDYLAKGQTVLDAVLDYEKIANHPPTFDVVYGGFATHYGRAYEHDSMVYEVFFELHEKKEDLSPTENAILKSFRFDI